MSRQNAPISKSSIFPVCVFGPDKNGIAPFCLARFRAKIFFALGYPQRLFGLIDFFPARMTTDDLPGFTADTHAFLRTIFGMASFQEKRFAIKFSGANFAFNNRHIIILSNNYGNVKLTLSGTTTNSSLNLYAEETARRVFYPGVWPLANVRS